MNDAPIGLILAAGLGQRLRPLTDYWPKPLIPFLGTTPFALAYMQLRRLGVTEIWFNTHYRHLDFGHHVGLLPGRVHESFEPILLGTGGVLNALRPGLKNREMVIVNGDVVAPFDLAGLLKTHHQSQALATMILLNEVIPGETAVWHRDQQVYAIQKDPVVGLVAGNFACAQVLSPDFFDLLPQSGVFDIINFGYRKALAERKTVACHIHNNYWFDIGSHAGYYNALQNVLCEPLEQGFTDLVNHLQINITRTWYGKKALKKGMPTLDLETAPVNLTIDPSSFVEQGSTIGSDTHLERCILLPGSIIPAGTAETHCIYGPFGKIDVSGKR